MPHEQLKAAGAFVRRGQLTLIAGGPGTGKSLFAHDLIQRGDNMGSTTPALYFSADSDSGVMFKRATAIATGYQMTDIERLMDDGDLAGLEQAVQSTTSHIRLDFRSQVTDQEMLDEIDAYAEVWGRYPEVIVMDNLSNLVVEGAESEFHGLQENCFFLHDIARDTNASVITLHHVSGEFEGATRPIPLSGIRGKVSKTPEVIFTLVRDGNTMNVSIVKNRNGRAFADGSNAIQIPVDLSRMRLG